VCQLELFLNFLFSTHIQAGCGKIKDPTTKTAISLK